MDPTEVARNDSTIVATAKDELLTVFSSFWTSSTFDELDWSRLKELPIRESLDRRRAAGDAAQACHCIECPDFVKHFGMRHDEWLITDHIAGLQQLMSDQNLQLLPDYGQRIAVLKELGFIDENERVELKGKVACEVSNSSILLLTIAPTTKTLPRSTQPTNSSSPSSSSKTSSPLTRPPKSSLSSPASSSRRKPTSNLP